MILHIQLWDTERFIDIINGEIEPPKVFELHNSKLFGDCVVSQVSIEHYRIWTHMARGDYADTALLYPTYEEAFHKMIELNKKTGFKYKIIAEMI